MLKYSEKDLIAILDLFRFESSLRLAILQSGTGPATSRFQGTQHDDRTEASREREREGEGGDEKSPAAFDSGRRHFTQRCSRSAAAAAAAADGWMDGWMGCK